ncbi:MAG TPA: tetratricopeptide repeat protein [Myxococcaceae bacterium]|nr:tetratricopeptide repeat protein [Myxococcaceae bacterium]
MRLACENCAAVYLIDDGAMTSRGIRAQCPRCKNIQYVPPPRDPSVPVAVARAREMANPISVSRPPVPGREEEPEAEAKSQVARVTLTTRVVARPPAPPPEALASEGLAARAELFGELDWSEGEASDPGAPPVPAAATPVGGRAPEAGRPGTRSPAAPPAPPPPPTPALGTSSFTLEELFPDGESEATAESPERFPEGTCASCGGPLADLDDVASGVCARCRQAAAARLAPVPQPAPPAPALAPEPPRGTGPADAGPRPVPRSAPLSSPRRTGWGVLAALAAVFLLGVGAVVWLRTRGAGPLPGATFRHGTPRMDPSAPLPPALAERLAAWRLAYPTGRPLPEAALAEAQQALALDQPESSAQAQRRLEAALVDAPRDPALLGTWLRAVALARGTALDGAEGRTLIELGERLLGATGRAPAVLLGLAELLLVTREAGAEERARALAQEVIAADGANQAEAHLLLAKSYARTSADLALAELQRAEQLDSSQRRIPVVRAEAYTLGGDPRRALAALQARLALEPDHPGSLFAMGRLLVEVGEPEQAHRLFERLQADPRTEDGPALLALAALETQVQGRPREAMQLVRAALKRGRLKPVDRVQANVLLAAAARAAGDADAAAAAARTALGDDARHPEAHLILLLLALDRGDGAGAEEHLPAVVGRLGDPGVEGLVEGRVRLALGQAAAAAEAFERTAAADARRTDALLWAAATRASVPDRGPALAHAIEAARADPTRAGPWVPLGSIAPRPEEWLRGAEGRLARLSTGDDDATPLLGEAVLHFHRRDLAGAESLLARVLHTDAAHPQALAWRALVLLERGDAKGAAAAAAAAQSGGRALPLVNYAAGASALAVGDLEGARRALRDALQAAPTLLASEVKLAEVEVRSGAPAAARERLRKVVQIDPSYAAAKRALYLLPQEH